MSVRDGGKSSNGNRPAAAASKFIQKALLKTDRWRPESYSLAAVDEEEKCVAEAREREKKAAVKVLSDLQSGVGTERRRCFVVPAWAALLTPDGAERAVLGVVDYWLGLDGDRRLRANKDFVTTADGFYWYVVSAGQLARQVFLNVKQVRRAVTRLDAAGLLRKGVHTKGGRNVALRLRLNWPVIEQRVADAWGQGVEDGDDE